jgi:hypothetical protein
MTAPIIPNIPDITGETVSKDPQLRDVLIAIKTTLEKIVGSTSTELDELLEKNE